MFAIVLNKLHQTEKCFKKIVLYFFFNVFTPVCFGIAHHIAFWSPATSASYTAFDADAK